MSNRDLGLELRNLLGPLQNLNDGGPLRVVVPAVLGLTGPGAAYGLMQRDGLLLGAQHVNAWTDGRLEIECDIYDHGSCVPGSGVPDAGALGVGGGTMITSFVFCFGAQVPAIQASKTFALDPVGGTGIALQGQPYCYGLRSSWPDDTQEGLWSVIRSRHPNADRWVVVSPEYAAGWDGPLRRRLAGIAETLGIELGFISAPYGASDYSGVVAEMREASADVYVLLQYGQDIVHTTLELERQGMLDKAIYVSLEYDREQVEAVGHLWGGWYVGHEDFDVAVPGNAWSRLFIDEYQRYTGETPQNYSALMYSTVFIIATLVDRLVGFGGDLASGDDFVKALELDPTLPHLYGSGPGVGRLIMDLDTHSPKSLPLVALRSDASGSTRAARRIATYDVRGRSIQVLDAR